MDSSPHPAFSGPWARVTLTKDLVLDPRRAAWFARDRVLAVADTHLGFPWVQRQRGQLLPVHAPDDTVQRLLALVSEYQPFRLVILGDVVHAATNLPALEGQVRELTTGLPDSCGLVLVLGNHDARLISLFNKWNLKVSIVDDFLVGTHLLLHGHDTGTELIDLRAPGTIRIMGHEHPAIGLGDGVATHVRVPCFMVADLVVVVPAFSAWASGCDIRRGVWLSRLAREARFQNAYACMGPRLLRIPLG